MSTIGFEDRVLSKVVDEYIRTRRNTDWPISVSSAVKAVRYVSPSPSLSDQDLASVIVAAVIAQGRNLAFDMGSSAIESPGGAFEVRDHG